MTPSPDYSLYRMSPFPDYSLLFNTKSAILQLYHGENKLIFNVDDDEVRFVLDQHVELDFYSNLDVNQVLL
jgi:hypothetical protein